MLEGEGLGLVAFNRQKANSGKFAIRNPAIIGHRQANTGAERPLACHRSFEGGGGAVNCPWEGKELGAVGQLVNFNSLQIFATEVKRHSRQWHSSQIVVFKQLERNAREIHWESFGWDR